MSLEQMHTAEEVAESLCVTKFFVYSQCRAKRWPHLRVGNKLIRFTDEQVEQIREIITVDARPPEDESARERNRRVKKLLGVAR